ncbi:MAG: ABC transporter permease [SAR116 cluster bacterium]|mgnify:FL=1|nr:MAG: ABC transporter permease [SAR116 cluster bacterium]|tara:strand:+ start:597 stop:1508 length:912 start_codon:yes stop_codon:yes gene_type:complete
MEQLILTVILTSVPLIFAASGELIAERSGVLNLGVEGMMLMGAVSAFAIAMGTGSPILGMFAGAFAGALTAGIFAFFALGLATNQVATGLALTIFGTGLSGLIGAPLVGHAIDGLPQIHIPLLADIPILGMLLFQHDIMVYLAVIMVGLCAWVLNATRVGLIIRAVGDNHDSAHALGYSVLGVRLLAVMFGGMMAGLGGAYLPLVLTPHWAEGMTAGRGWIALALVVFASWRPWRVLGGALVFGGITIMQLAGQARGWTIPSQFLSMLPYLATIIVLVLIARNREFALANSPACLGRIFHAGK